MTGSSRRWASCNEGHEYEVEGIDHWNPWGPDTFEVTGSLQCPVCGLVGQCFTRKMDALKRTADAGFDLLSRPPLE